MSTNERPPHTGGPPTHLRATSVEGAPPNVKVASGAKWSTSRTAGCPGCVQDAARATESTHDFESTSSRNQTSMQVVALVVGHVDLATLLALRAVSRDARRVADRWLRHPTCAADLTSARHTWVTRAATREWLLYGSVLCGVGEHVPALLRPIAKKPARVAALAARFTSDHGVKLLGEGGPERRVQSEETAIHPVLKDTATLPVWHTALGSSTGRELGQRGQSEFSELGLDRQARTLPRPQAAAELQNSQPRQLLPGSTAGGSVRIIFADESRVVAMGPEGSIVEATAACWGHARHNEAGSRAQSEILTEGESRAEGQSRAEGDSLAESESRAGTGARPGSESRVEGGSRAEGESRATGESPAEGESHTRVGSRGGGDARAGQPAQGGGSAPGLGPHTTCGELHVPLGTHSQMLIWTRVGEVPPELLPAKARSHVSAMSYQQSGAGCLYISGCVPFAVEHYRVLRHFRNVPWTLLPNQTALSAAAVPHVPQEAAGNGWTVPKRVLDRVPEATSAVAIHHYESKRKMWRRWDRVLQRYLTGGGAQHCASVMLSSLDVVPSPLSGATLERLTALSLVGCAVTPHVVSWLGELRLLKEALIVRCYCRQEVGTKGREVRLQGVALAGVCQAVAGWNRLERLTTDAATRGLVRALAAGTVGRLRHVCLVEVPLHGAEWLEMVGRYESVCCRDCPPGGGDARLGVDAGTPVEDVGPRATSGGARGGGGDSVRVGHVGPRAALGTARVGANAGARAGDSAPHAGSGGARGGVDDRARVGDVCPRVGSVGTSGYNRTRVRGFSLDAQKGSDKPEGYGDWGVVEGGKQRVREGSSTTVTPNVTLHAQLPVDAPMGAYEQEQVAGQVPQVPDSAAVSQRVEEAAPQLAQSSEQRLRGSDDPGAVVSAPPHSRHLLRAVELGWQAPRGWVGGTAAAGQLDGLTSLRVGLGARVTGFDLAALAARRPPLAELRVVGCTAPAETVLQLANTCGVRHLGVVHPLWKFAPLRGPALQRTGARGWDVEAHAPGNASGAVGNREHVGERGAFGKLCPACSGRVLDPRVSAGGECSGEVGLSRQLRSGARELGSGTSSISQPHVLPADRQHPRSCPAWRAWLESIELRGPNILLTSSELRGLLPDCPTWLAVVRITWVGAMRLGEVAASLTSHAPGLRELELGGLRTCSSTPQGQCGFVGDEWEPASMAGTAPQKEPDGPADGASQMAVPSRGCCVSKLLHLLDLTGRLREVDFSELGVQFPPGVVAAWAKSGVTHVRLRRRQAIGLEEDGWLRVRVDRRGLGVALDERVWRWAEGTSVAWLVEVGCVGVV